MFNFGNKKPDIKQYAIIGIILSSVIVTLSQCTHIKENVIWDLFDEIQRTYFPGTILNQFIINDSDKLNRRIPRDIDRAIDSVTPEYDRIIREANKKYQSRYQDLPNDDTVCYSKECKALAPPMRICSPWVDGCSKEW
jgi:hypothetical protein